MTVLSRLLGKRPDSRDALRPLWHRVVEIAREKRWYAELGVADTVPGRFDAVTLVMALVMLRMERDKDGNRAMVEAAARLTELFVDDMDGQLRQSGVGDLVVGKRMGRLVSVLGGRIGALRDALPTGPFGMTAVLERNVTLTDKADSVALANAVLTLHRRIEAASDAELMAGTFAR